MSLIKPRTRGKQFVRLTTRLDRENDETLYAYAHFIGESAGYVYVLNQLVESVVATDKEFVAWPAEHRDSYAPLPARQRRKQDQAMQTDRARGVTDARGGLHRCRGIGARRGESSG